ncbi:MAG TPA: nuclear transport factor 2 family protein [Pyrinomonadaceae bacterium]|nr:nuclear transport factor 2 family protein [Pyrinomonadaceae bacterium]
MRKIKSHSHIFFAAALTLAALSVSPLAAAAQEKGKEAQKPPAGTADAWRQALPPEAEAKETAEASAAVTQPRLTREAAEKALNALERKWMDSLRQRDASALSQLVSDDFTLVSPRLVVAAGDRDKYFRHAMRELNLASYEFEALTVRLYGRTAVVTGRLKQSANVAGEDWGGSYLFTDVWVSRDGAWQVVSRHTSPLPPEKR